MRVKNFQILIMAILVTAFSSMSFSNMSFSQEPLTNSSYTNTPLSSLSLKNKAIEEYTTVSESSYEVIYDDERIGHSERVHKKSNSDTVYIEGTNMLFRSFLGDSRVKSMTIEQYNDTDTLQHAHYIALIDEYLWYSKVTSRDCECDLLSYSVTFFELSSDDEEAMHQSFQKHLGASLNTASLGKELDQFIQNLKSEEDYLFAVDRKDFDYTIAQLERDLGNLVKTGERGEFRLFDPLNEGNAVFKVQANAKLIAEQGRQIQLGLNEKESREYFYDKHHSSLTLMRIVEHEEDDRIELVLRQ